MDEPSSKVLHVGVRRVLPRVEQTIGSNEDVAGIVDDLACERITHRDMPQSFLFVPFTALDDLVELHELPELKAINDPGQIAEDVFCGTEVLGPIAVKCESVGVRVGRYVACAFLILILLAGQQVKKSTCMTSQRPASLATLLWNTEDNAGISGFSGRGIVQEVHHPIAIQYFQLEYRGIPYTRLHSTQWGSTFLALLS